MKMRHLLRLIKLDFGGPVEVGLVEPSHLWGFRRFGDFTSAEYVNENETRVLIPESCTQHSLKIENHLGTLL